MTREEAINSLNHMIEWGDPEEVDEDACKMGITALEQEPCDDAVSRDGVYGILMRGDFVDRLSYETFKNRLEQLPSVNPQEPKTGHWEWVQYDDNPKLGNWHCSECRSVVIECVYKNEKAGIPLYKYCPQCGAKMVEPQESEGEE